MLGAAGGGKHGGCRMLGAAGGGKPRLQALFKSLLESHLLLSHWRCRSNGQGEGWGVCTSKGLGRREA